VTPHDRANLEFLLTATPEQLAAWHSTVTLNDIAYAQELMDRFAQELQARALDLVIEAELSLMHSYPDAVAVLQRFLPAKFG
jgi:hypothetical protein